MTGKRNILGWEDMVSQRSRAFEVWFRAESKFLHRHIAKGASVLEVGCGYGRSLLDISDITKDLTGVDNDKVAVNHAKKSLRKFPKTRIILAEGNKLPFESGTFDTVLCLTTFANLYEKKFKALAEMRRVLKEDGRVIISVYADNALKERMKLYKKINAEIKGVSPNGTVVFNQFNGYSEQFSRSDLEKIFKKARLRPLAWKRVSIAHICMLSKLPDLRR